MWFRHWYERRSERASLEEALARGFTEEPLSAEEVVQYLEKSAAQLDRDEAVVLQVLNPAVMFRAAERLAALQPVHAHVYTEYLAYGEVLASANQWLRDSLNAYNRSTGVERANAAKAAKLAMLKVADTVRRLEQAKADIAQFMLTEGLAKPAPETVRRLRKAAEASRVRLGPIANVHDPKPSANSS